MLGAFEKEFGGVVLEDTFKTLVKSEKARQVIIENLGQDQGREAIKLLTQGGLTQDLEHEFHDLFSWVIQENSEIVWEGTICNNPENINDPDANFSIHVREYEGVFRVETIEFDSSAYFLSLDEAKAFALCNWDTIKEGE